MNAEEKTVQSGLFRELDSSDPDRYNPLKIDPTLDNETAESVVLKYKVDGVVSYAVSIRATTLIVGDSDDGGTAVADTLEFLNGSVNASNIKMIGNGKLYRVISDLQSNDRNTLYLLPGTYREGTTVGVSSSMDIIGLGAGDDVKVIKQAASSNRHLFNCSGTKADYIEVTLRNLHLDATAKTTNNKDNAVDGVKYPAYLYVEHCSLNTTRTFGVVTTSGTYRFYHTGLTYGNGASNYTNNSGSIKNVHMDSGDREW